MAAQEHTLGVRCKWLVNKSSQVPIGSEKGAEPGRRLAGPQYRGRYLWWWWWWFRAWVSGGHGRVS